MINTNKTVVFTAFTLMHNCVMEPNQKKSAIVPATSVPGVKYQNCLITMRHLHGGNIVLPTGYKTTFESSSDREARSREHDCIFHRLFLMSIQRLSADLVMFELLAVGNQLYQQR